VSWIGFATAAALTATATAVVVVQPGETLEQIAQRALGDARGAAELKSLNGLTADSVPAGTSLKLPGPERARALSALLAARNALSQSDPSATGHGEASASFDKAEQLFQAAKYDEAAAAADATWRLLSGSTQQNTRFAVQVVDGVTKVSSQSGQPVRVEREGLARPVHPGQTLTVGSQIPPAGALDAPSLIFPSDLARVAMRPTEKGIGPITLTWQAVPGAARYSLEIAPVEGTPGKPTALNVERPEARVALSAGKYAWWVRAVESEGGQSVASSRRTFELSIEPLKLEVKKTPWK
jgi:LysM repeat protein